ncbi:DoxX family membrane protein [Rhodocytophaga rosea]|uniref:DoxX family membrane protein n=1 Tax=Rhodocytophaga rosea TaxID=2704465 RepID=A0A6C0GB60_9BACT|nr:DoxX family membrane protein [Rhodocytophaga rosea]QHT65175.1 DoxX family membrane protein [Rhodocytophaga rosea]
MTTISIIQPLQLKGKITFILCLLSGLLFLNAGLNKFFNYMPVPEDLPQEMIKMSTAMMQIGWLLPLVAVAEILGGILLIIPKYRALGAIILLPVILGILLTHLTVAPQGLPMAFILLIIILWVIIDNRAKYLQLIN